MLLKVHKTLLHLGHTNLSILFVCTTSYIVGTVAKAQTNLVPVKWYKPQLAPSKIEGQARVIFSGKTLSRSIIKIDNKDFFIIKKLSQKDQLKGAKFSKAEKSYVTKTKKTCTLFTEPNDGSQKLRAIKRKKKVRIHAFNKDWFWLSYKKKPAFLSKNCFSKKFSQRVLNNNPLHITQTVSDNNGEFEIPIYLPFGSIQVPILIQQSRSKKATFLVLFYVDKKNVTINAKVSKRKIKKGVVQYTPYRQFPRKWLWLGVGGSFQQYSQKVGGLNDISFQNLKYPALSFRGGALWNNWGVDFKYASNPGAIEEAIAPFTIEKGDYNWQTISLEGIYLIRPKTPGMTNEWHLRLGVQQESIPFLDSTATNALSVETTEILTAKVGVKSVMNKGRRTSLEMEGHYQIPLSSTSDRGEFTLTPSLSFDLGIGLVHHLKDKYYAGLYATGQWHEFSFDFKGKNGNLDSSGNQSLFSTSFEIRLGYEF